MAVAEAVFASAWNASSKASAELEHLPPRLPRRGTLDPSEIRLPRLSYAHCVSRYGTDRPDRRIGMPIADITHALYASLAAAAASSGSVSGSGDRDGDSRCTSHTPSSSEAGSKLLLGLL